MKGGEKLRRFLTYGVMAVGVLSLVFGNAVPGWAGSVDCGRGCGWEIIVNGESEADGRFAIDDDGNVRILGDTEVEGDGFTAAITSYGGNTDPEQVFGLGATNTSNQPTTYAFSFSLPLGGLPTPIASTAELGVTLTAPSGGMARLFPTLGGGLIVDSQDIRFIDTEPFVESVDKGVDVGTAFVAPAGTTRLRLQEAEGGILSGGPFDLMVVTVAFGLTDEDPGPSGAGVGLSGRVTQTVVPIPAAAWLFGTGLLALIGFRKRFQR